MLLPKYFLKLASLSVPTVQPSFLVLFTFYCTSRWLFPSTPVQYPHYSPNFLPKNKIWPYPLKTWPVPCLFLTVQCPICSTQGSNLVFQPIPCLTHVFFQSLGFFASSPIYAESFLSLCFRTHFSLCLTCLSLPQCLAKSKTPFATQIKCHLLCKEFIDLPWKD